MGVKNPPNGSSRAAGPGVERSLGVPSRFPPGCASCRRCSARRASAWACRCAMASRPRSIIAWNPPFFMPAVPTV